MRLSPLAPGASRPARCWRLMCARCNAGRRPWSNKTAWKADARPRRQNAPRPINSAMRSERRFSPCATKWSTRACRPPRSYRAWQITASTWPQSRVFTGYCVTLSNSIGGGRPTAAHRTETGRLPGHRPKPGVELGYYLFGRQYPWCVLSALHGAGYF